VFLYSFKDMQIIQGAENDWIIVLPAFGNINSCLSG
jgi:hypothetical protein